MSRRNVGTPQQEFNGNTFIKYKGVNIAPEYNFSELTNEELEQIMAAGETGAGYIPFQQAAALRLNRVGRTEAQKRLASDQEKWIFDLPEAVIANLNRIIGKR